MSTMSLLFYFKIYVLNNFSSSHTQRNIYVYYILKIGYIFTFFNNNKNDVGFC